MHSRIQHEIEPSCVLPVFFWHVKDFGAARDGDADGLKSLPMDIRWVTHEWPDVFTIPAEIETFHNRVSIACQNRLGMTLTLQIYVLTILLS